MRRTLIGGVGALLLAVGFLMLCFPTYISTRTAKAGVIDPGFAADGSGYVTMNRGCGPVVMPQDPQRPGDDPGIHPATFAQDRHACALQRDHRLDLGGSVAASGLLLLGGAEVIHRRGRRSAGERSDPQS